MCSAACVCSAAALYWTGYELLRSRFGAAMHPQTFDPAAPPVGVSFTAGALAGSVRHAAVVVVVVVVCT